MRLKTFFGASQDEALAQAQAWFGPQGVVLACETGTDGVRLLAATESETFEPLASLFRAAPPPARDVAQDVAETLDAHGFPADLAAVMLAPLEGLVTDDPLLALGMALDAVLGFHPLPGDGREGPLALVGSAGSGKTLAVAKLAARAVFTGTPVRVICTDGVRAGAKEQLAAFLRLLELPLLTLETPEQLAEALAGPADDALVLVDTAATNPRDADEVAELRRLLAAGKVEPVLALPAGLDHREALDQAETFQRLGVRRLLPTRVDASRRLGGVLTAASRLRLLLADAGISAKVAQGLTPLSSVSLARLLMPEAGQSLPAPPAATPRRTRLSRRRHPAPEA